MKPLPVSKLGSQIFIITDDNDTFLRCLRVAISRLSGASSKFYTLHHCCPAVYWEHAGDPRQEAKQEVKEVWRAEESTLARTKRYFGLVCAMLQEFGVPADHIRTHLTVEEDNPLKAVVEELDRGPYSGVIVSSYHYDLIKRLEGGGVTDIFRHRPNVEVWVLDSDRMGLAQPQ